MLKWVGASESLKLWGFPIENGGTMAQTKKLYRRPKEGKIFGVAAGLAEYFDIDVTLLRIIMVALVIAGVEFIIPIYLLLALLLPTNDAEAKAGISASSVQSNFSRLSTEFTESGASNRAKHYLGIGLIIGGAWLLLARLFPEIFQLSWEFFVPVSLILIGVVLLSRKGGR